MNQGTRHRPNLERRKNANNNAPTSGPKSGWTPLSRSLDDSEAFVVRRGAELVDADEPMIPHRVIDQPTNRRKANLIGSTPQRGRWAGRWPCHVSDPIILTGEQRVASGGIGL